MQSSIIREGADREGMQGVLTLGGRRSQAQVGALLMPGRYISERLVLYSQSHFVPLEGADVEGKASEQRPTHGSNRRSEQKG